MTNLELYNGIREYWKSPRERQNMEVRLIHHLKIFVFRNPNTLLFEAFSDYVEWYVTKVICKQEKIKEILA